MTRRFVIPALCLAVLAGGTAHADAPLDFQRAPDSARVELAEPVRFAQRQISASEAKRIALRRHPGGDVVDISRSGNIYRVRVVTRDGRRVDVLVDSNSGRVVG